MSNTQKVPARVKGMPMPIKKAIREPRNTQVTSVTNSRPNSALVCMMLSAVRVGTVWSSSSKTLIPCGPMALFCCAI